MNQDDMITRQLIQLARLIKQHRNLLQKSNNNF